MENIKKIIAIIVFGIITHAASAGGVGSIKGNLIDEYGAAVVSAHVYFYSGAGVLGSVSDLDGKFNIKAIAPGSYDVYVTSMMFDTLKISGVRVIGNRITMLRNQKMQLKTLGEAVVVGIIYDIPLIDIDEPGVYVIGGKEIVNMAGKNNLTSMIASMTPGVYQKEPGDPLQMRGSRGGASTYFIDGVKSQGISTNFPSASIGTIRVFTGGIPAMYGDVVGGVVIIETKSFMSWYKKPKY